jgi:hypothetical protein
MSTLTTATKYFGCDIAVNGQTFKMWSIVPDGVWYTHDRKDKVAKWGEWQAELKPLSEITDDDAVEVARLMGFSNDPFLINRVKRVLCQEYGDVGYFKPITEYRDVVDYIRSRYYDIDNLIAKGEAVKL